MNKEDFIKLITNQQEFTSKVDLLHKEGIDLINSDFFDYPCRLFDKILDISFTDEGTDWIDWYLYERNPNSKEPQAWDDCNNPIKTETLDDLWELVKNYVK